MRKPSGKRTPRTTKRQSKVAKVSDTSVDVVNIERQGAMIHIELRTPAQAEKFYAEFKLQMEVDTFLKDIPEDDAEGVLRTLKVKQ